MRAIRSVGIVVLLLVFATSSKAGWPAPSFQLDCCSWQATHVVVVSEGDKIDGEVEVLECWKGDLKKGDKLSLPDLAEFAPEKERFVSKGVKKKKDLPASVSGTRMVLFLRKREKAEKGQPTGTTWLPAAVLGGMHVSVAWIEGDRVFAFTQEVYPGPRPLLSQGLDEQEMKKKVDAVLTAQTALTEAVRKGDEAKVVKLTLDLVRSDSPHLPDAVLTDLGYMGAKGLPGHRAVLKDDKLLEHHYSAVTVLRHVGAADAGPELVKVLERELAFWKKVAPDLPKGWMNGAEGKVELDELKRLLHHYYVAHAAVFELGKLRYAGGREAVTEFGEYWKSLPQLIEVKQIAEACDDTLKALPRK